MNGAAASIMIISALIIAIGGLIFYFLYTRHRERIMLIERGVEATLLRPGPKKLNYFFAVLAGIFFICLALGLGVASWIDWSYSDGYRHPVGAQIYFISIFLFIGIGFVSSFFLHRKLVK